MSLPIGTPTSGPCTAMYCTLRRSMAIAPLAAYVRAYGNRIGAHTDGASYKILSLIGHGAKTLNVYSFGSAFLFGNCWSEQFDSYRPIAEAIKLIGRSERVLFPGQPVPGQVAIFLPNASRLWDEQIHAPYYLREIQYLHMALIHAGYRVEFVDDLDLAQGMLSRRTFTTLYLTGPNVSVQRSSRLKPGSKQAVRWWSLLAVVLPMNTTNLLRSLTRC